MITKGVEKLIKELIAEGWSFDLVWTDMHSEGNFRWEADFTRRIEGGKWDNHESGIDADDPNEAIREAYDNIRSGKRLKKG